ncbi:MAG: tRNA pseudouridine(38-40) synthase TruA, partial [Proteobacteria bacterium]|nr:tRNA pseudouridine(38-40) synthase TruA [Pseudomonadota bacterium]
MNFRLVLEYDGTEFDGWQSQAGATRTVQGCLADAFEQVAGAPAAVTGSGRTDAGVHAEGQVANARLETRLDPATLLRAVNALLPRDIVVLELERAPEGFDARRCARSKLYRYRVWNSPV